MKPYRILITGSRDWEDAHKIEQELYNHVNEMYRAGKADKLVIVHGDCPTGADRMAADWASSIPRVIIEAYPANWNRYGKSAGFIRNSEMVNRGADILFAFIKDDSKGASMTLDIATKAGIPAKVFRTYGNEHPKNLERLDLE